MRLLTWVCPLAAVALCVAIPLQAQAPDDRLCPDSTARTTELRCAIGRIAASAAALPVDRIADLLALEPGVSSLEQGDLSIRGSGRDAITTFLDGVPLTPGRRDGKTALLGGSWFGEAGSGTAIGTNAFDAVSLMTGVGPAEFASARGGVIGVASRDPASATRRIRFGGSWATDAPFGTGHGLDFNRLGMTGDLNSGRLTVGVSAILEGQGSARLGLDQNASPVYLSDGIDTTVTVNGPGGTTSVDVLRFTPSPGIRIPASATSSYALLTRGGYRLGEHSRVQLTVLASQRQARQFDYANLYNPPQLGAEREWSRAITGSWFGDLIRTSSLRLAADLHLSWQTDRSTRGPLTPAGESDSRSPFGGFLLAPLDFRFTTGSFPVNDALIRNFRTNSGRLSPYDLRNTTQYQLVDEYRNNAYGLTGFSDRGGPVGLVQLSEENRLIAKVAATGCFGERQCLRAGAEMTGYRERFYSSQLTSQALADAYLESPKRQMAFADYELALKEVTVKLGVRYDRFKSGASRPYYTDPSGNRSWFPRISTMPGFNPANPTAGFVADGSHSRMSPSLRAEFRASPSVVVHTGIAETAQLPDFAQIFAGINTDLSITTPTQVYGSDLGFERRVLAEVGARVALDPRTSVDGSIWIRSDKGVTSVGLATFYDPFVRGPRDVYRFVNGSDRTGKGLDVRLSRDLGSGSRAWLAYSRTESNLKNQPLGFLATGNVPLADSRPHSIVGAVLYQTPQDLRALGGVLRNVGLYGSFRFATGTAYTACSLGSVNDEGTLSGEPCIATIANTLNGSRLSSTKLLDLRLTKSFPVGGTRLTAFADARNLLNWRNLTRVFAQTGSSSNARERASHLATDLQGFVLEASRNGKLLADSTIDLTFGGAQDPRSACGGWQSSTGADVTPNCVYLLNAEARFGNGDHLFTPAEQARASDAYYLVLRGLQNFTSSGRRVRLGLEVQF